MTDNDQINELELELISYKTQCDAQTTLIEDLSGKLATALSGTDEASKIRIRELEAEKDNIFNMYRQLQAAGGEESNVDYQQVVKENQKLQHQMNEQQDYNKRLVADKQKEIDLLKSQLLNHVDNEAGDFDFALAEIQNELKQKSEELSNFYAQQGSQDSRISELNHQILQLKHQNQDILQQLKEKDEIQAKFDQQFESQNQLNKMQEQSVIELDMTVRKQKDQIAKLMKVAKLYEDQSVQMKQLQQNQLQKTENESVELTKLREHEQLYSKMLADSYAAMTKKDQELRTKEQRIKDLEDQIRAQNFDSQLSQKRYQSEQEHLKSQIEVTSRAARQNISLARQNIYQASPSSGSVMLSQTGEYRSTSRASQQLRASSTKLRHMMD